MEEKAETYASNTFYGPHRKEFVELCVRGTKGHDYHVVRPEKGEAEFLKFHPSGFSSKDFSRYLEEHGITQLVLTGVITSRCLNATVVAGSALGYECVIVEDLTAGPSHLSDEITQHLNLTCAFYAQRVSSGQFISKMNDLRLG